jgi:NAD(P) transhydrogenase
VKKGAKVQIEKGAGAAAGYTDAEYEKLGATITDAGGIWKSDVVVKINTPTKDEAASLENRHLVCQLGARQNEALVDSLAKQGATVLDFTMLLRTLSRGQSFDVLSSQANIAGYRSVVEAAATIQRPFAGSMTPAGRVKPSKVIVVGAGVAGLAAIQQAKNMNANVYGFDVRAAASEQVEAMKAKFLSVEFDEDGSAAGGYAKEMSPEWFEAANKMLLKEMADTNVVITTALIPGRKAPVLITEAMVAAMPPGSVTVDLAAEAGGNVETTKPGEVITTANGVTCIGHMNMPARMANMASQMFGGNATKLIVSMATKGDDKEYQVDLEDTAVRSMCIIDGGSKLEPYVPPPPRRRRRRSWRRMSRRRRATSKRKPHQT